MSLEKFLEETPKKNIIFDFDSTIVELILPWSKLTRQIRKIGAGVDKGFTQKIHAINSLSKITNLLISRYGSGSWIITTKLWQDFEARYLRNYKVNEDLIDFIKNNDDKYNFYIWSSNTSPTVEKILGELGIKDSFKKIITKDRVKYVKPYPDGFYNIYDEKDHRKTYLMVGDHRINDGEAALKSGIDFFHVDYF